MVQWWDHHKSKLPTFKDVERAEIEDLTGCIPLLLQPLFQWSQQDFCAVENYFWASSEIVAVEQNIKEFSNEIKLRGEDAYNE